MHRFSWYLALLLGVAPRLAEAAAKAAPATPPSAKTEGAAPPVTFRAAPGEGATIEAGDSYSLNIKARMQLRYELAIAPPDAAFVQATSQSVSIGTARLYFGGHALTRELKYLVQLAFAARDYRDGATSPLYDAYLDWTPHRDFSLKVGQYFIPFDRLRTVSEWALQTGERPQPVQLFSLDRDVGVTVYSNQFLADDSPVAVRLGVFGGGGTTLGGVKEPGVLAVGRLELRPLGKIDDDREGDLERRPKPALALGAAVAQNWNTNRVRSVVGGYYTSGTVDYFHAAADVIFKWRGVALEGALILREAGDDLVTGTDPADPEYSQSGRGWVFQGSYLFDPPVELVARISRVQARDGTDPTLTALTEATGQELAGAVNYYLNGHKLKLQADYNARMPHDFDFSRAAQTVHVQIDATF